MVAERIEVTTYSGDLAPATVEAFTLTAVVSNFSVQRFEDARDAFSAIVPLEGEDYPTLVRIWDNDDDAIYDQV